MPLFDVVLPVFLLIAAGYVLVRRGGLDARPAARLATYLLVPAMVLNNLLTAELQAGEVMEILAFGVVWATAMGALTMGLGRALGFRPSQRAALVLATAFSNAANYGLPVVFYAFGQAGFDRAMIFVVYNTIAMGSVAVYFAARSRALAGAEAAAGGSPVGVWRQALLSSLRMPLLQAALLGVALRLTGLPLPGFLGRSISLLGQGALPLLVVVLGMQLAGINLQGAAARVAAGTVLKVAVAPVLAWGVTAALGLESFTARVLIVEAAMPTAVNTTLLAIDFDADADVVTSTTLVTTALSLGTLPVTLFLLQ